MRIGMGINLNQPQRIGPDGSTCSQAIPLTVSGGMTVNGTVTSSGETWYKLSGPSGVTITFGAGIRVVGYSGSACGSLVEDGNAVGPGFIEVEVNGFFKVVASSGTAYSLTLALA